MPKLKVKYTDVEDEDIILVKILHISPNLSDRGPKSFKRKYFDLEYSFGVSYKGPYCYYLEKKNTYTDRVVDVSICLGGSAEDISSDTMIFDKKGRDTKEMINIINDIFNEISK